MIEREVLHKKTRKQTLETALGVTSRRPEQAGPKRLIEINRGHWTIENRCHDVIDWNFDEDRGRIRAGHGPENVSRLRRFAVGILHHFSDAKTSITKKMAHLNRNIRLVFDYLRMTRNSIGNAQAIAEALAACGASLADVVAFASIHLKVDEPSLADVAGQHGWRIRFHPAAELAQEYRLPAAYSRLISPRFSLQ